MHQHATQEEKLLNDITSLIDFAFRKGAFGFEEAKIAVSTVVHLENTLAEHNELKEELRARTIELNIARTDAAIASKNDDDAQEEVEVEIPGADDKVLKRSRK